MKAHSILLFYLILIPSTLFAEVSLCRGVWTSKPCTDSPTTSSPTTEVAKDPTFPERRRLYTDVDLETFRARRDGRGDISISSARDVCIGGNPSLELCRKETSLILEKLQTLKRDLENKKAETEKINDQDKNNSAIEENHITIINNTTTFNMNKKSNKLEPIATPSPRPNDFRIK